MVAIDAKPVVYIICCIVFAARRHLQWPGIWICSDFMALDILQASDEVGGIFTDKKRIFSWCLENSSPSRIPNNIDVGTPEGQASMP